MEEASFIERTLTPFCISLLSMNEDILSTPCNVCIKVASVRLNSSRGKLLQMECC